MWALKLLQSVDESTETVLEYWPLIFNDIVKTIREGRYQLDHDARILGDSLAISVQSSIKLPGEVYDPIAYVYFLRMHAFHMNLGNSVHFHEFM